MFLFALLALLVSSARAAHFHGTMMTYYPKEIQPDGSVEVKFLYKSGFSLNNAHSAVWSSSGNCGNGGSTIEKTVQQDARESWIQKEGIFTCMLPNNAPFTLQWTSGNWISNIDGINGWKAQTEVEVRTRSDTGKPNSSPQITILPALRIPSNCQRDYNLLAFDPDGDEVKCRYGVSSECDSCKTQSILTVSLNCTFSFSPISSSSVGSYVIQLVVEDFPRQNITLTQTDGSQEARSTDQAISKIPLQFILKVDPPVDSCEEGVYLPLSGYSTHGNGARLFRDVNQTVEINFGAYATRSTISNLLFSGPSGMNLTNSGSGAFTLTWTPSDSELGESHPICFVVQANFSGNVLTHSNLQCITVSVVPRTFILNYSEVNASSCPVTFCGRSYSNIYISVTSSSILFCFKDFYDPHLQNDCIFFYPEVTNGPMTSFSYPDTSNELTSLIRGFFPTVPDTHECNMYVGNNEFYTYFFKFGTETVLFWYMFNTDPKFPQWVMDSQVVQATTLKSSSDSRYFMSLVSICTMPADPTSEPTTMFPRSTATPTMEKTSALKADEPPVTHDPPFDLSETTTEVTTPPTSTMETTLETHVTFVTHDPPFDAPTPTPETSSPTHELNPATDMTTQQMSTPARSTLSTTMTKPSTLETHGPFVTHYPTFESPTPTPETSPPTHPTAGPTTRPTSATSGSTSSTAMQKRSTPGAEPPLVTPLPTDASTFKSTAQINTTPPDTPPSEQTPVPPGKNYVVGLSVKISTSLKEEEISEQFLKEFKDLLVQRGLPPDIALRIWRIQRTDMSGSSAQTP